MDAGSIGRDRLVIQGPTFGRNGSDTAGQLTSVHFNGTSRRLPGIIHLTPRELQVLALLAEGLPNKLICRRLGISGGTVKIHVSRVLAELGAASRLQAVVVAQRLGLLAVRPEAIEQQEVPTGGPPPHGHARDDVRLQYG